MIDVRSTARGLICLFTATIIFALPAFAQGNYVYVHNQDVASSVSAFAVSPAGALTPVAGSPFLTGGSGNTISCYGLDQITIAPAKNLLFVANSGDQTISAFSINPTDGTLASVAGSPFPSGLTLDGCQGISVAATPDGQFLMASSNGTINTFTIGANGALTFSQTIASAPQMAGLKISTNGAYLASATSTGVSMFTVQADGSLLAVAGSPFASTGTGALSGLDFSSCSNNRLYGGEATDGPGIADAWTVNLGGALTAVPSSPFASSGANSNRVLLSPNNALLFESNQFDNHISTLSVQGDGSLVNVGSYGTPLSIHFPVGMATDNSGSLLYVADDNFGVAVFRVNGDASLSPLADVEIANAHEIQGVAAYPVRTCANADLGVTMTASPNPVDAGASITYVITITNFGPDASAASVSDLLPAETTFVSCAATGGGVCSTPLNNAAPRERTISFASLANGETETITLVAQSSSTLLNNSTINNTASISNSSAVDANVANNSASASVSVNAPQAATALGSAPLTIAHFGGNAVLSATLSQLGPGTALSGKNVSFIFNGGAPLTAVTNASGVASVTVSVAGLNAGTYPASMSFAGDSTFAASSSASTVEVRPATLTVIANNASRAQGDPNPAFTYTVVGFLGTDNISLVTGSADCTSPATAASPLGTYPIVCSQGTLALLSGNYTFANADGGFSTVPGTLFVLQPLVVTINNATRAYGNPNPGFSGTITGLFAGDVITATYTTTATITSPVGTYAITPVFNDPGGKLGKYVVKISGGVFTITQAPLQVKVNSTSVSRAYGAVNPSFPSTVTGLKNGDPITVVYGTTATQSSPVLPTGQTYPITATFSDPASKLSNYAVTETDGALTITKAPLTVTASAQAIVLNGTVGANVTYSGFVLGQSSSVLTGTLSCSATVNTVGTKPITCSGQTSTNYALTFVQGTATVSYAAVGSCTAGPGHQYLGATTLTRAGLTNIPVTFRVCDANGTAVSPAGLVTNFTLVDKVTGTTTTTINQGLSTAFTFQAGAQNDLLNQAVTATTPGSGTSAGLPAGSKYDFLIKLNDGSTIPFAITMQ